MTIYKKFRHKGKKNTNVYSYYLVSWSYDEDTWNAFPSYRFLKSLQIFFFLFPKVHVNKQLRMYVYGHGGPVSFLRFYRERLYFITYAIIFIYVHCYRCLFPNQHKPKGLRKHTLVSNIHTRCESRDKSLEQPVFVVVLFFHNTFLVIF